MNDENNVDHQLFDKDFSFDFSSSTTYTSANYDSTKYDSIFHYSNIGKLRCDYTPLKSSAESSESHWSRIIRYCIALLCFIIVICTFPVSWVFCLKKVPALERIVIFRLGKLQKVKGPGFVIILPCIDHFIRVDLRPQMFTIPKQQFLTRDGAILELEAHFHYQLIDIIQSVLQVNKLDEVVKSLSLQCLRTALTSKDHEDIEKDIAMIQFHVKELMNKSTIKWGLEVIKLDMSPIMVLKVAEPRTAMSTLVSSIKSAMGMHDAEEELDQPSTSFASYTVPPTNTVIDNLKEKIEKASTQGVLRDMRGILKLDIVDYGQIFVILAEGYSLLEGSCDQESDVTVTLTTHSLSRLIDGSESAYQAYSNGSVKIEGDYNLLVSFAKKITES